jgi:peptidase M50-like protein
MAALESPSPTPILDLTQPLPRSEHDPLSRRDKLLLLGFAAALALMWNYPPLAPLAWILATGFVVTAVHELGHIIAGLCVGFRFRSVEVGPLRIERDSGKWIVTLANRGLGGGFTRMSLDRLRRVRRRLIVYIAGGLAATFLTGGLALAAFFLLPLSHNSGARGVLVWFGFWSVLGGVWYIFVRRVGRHPSDSARLWMLATSREQTRQLLASLALEMRRNSGDDLVLLNERWIKVATASGDRAFAGYSESWDRYIVAQAVPEAAQRLEECLASSGFLPLTDRDILIAEAATFTAWRRHDGVTATAWFARLAKPEKLSSLLRIRVEASISCVQGQFDDALALCEQGIGILRELGGRGSSTKHEASWIEWKSQIEQRRAAARTSSEPQPQGATGIAPRTTAPTPNAARR